MLMSNSLSMATWPSLCFGVVAMWKMCNNKNVYAIASRLIYKLLAALCSVGYGTSVTLCYCVDEVNARCSSAWVISLYSTSFVVRLTCAASSLCACQCRRWLDGVRFFFFFFPVFLILGQLFYFQFELRAHKNPFNCVQELFVICGCVSLERGHIFCSHLPLVDCFAYDYFAGPHMWQCLCTRADMH